MDQHDAGDGDADVPRQGRQNNSTSRDSNDVSSVVVPGGYAGDLVQCYRMVQHDTGLGGGL